MRFSVLSLLAASIIFSACDSGSSSEPSQISISGSLTEDAGYGKSADVEAAVVSATSMDADGRTVSHPDTAVTSADGRFTIQLTDFESHIILEALNATVESRVVVDVDDDRESMSAAPMNDESTAEADVFVAARSGGSDLTLARISAFVDARVAAEVVSGNTDASAVASLLLQGQQAEEEYVEDREADENPPRQPVEDKRESDRAAFLRLHAELAAAASAGAEQTAIEIFEAAFAEGYVDAGLSASLNAEAAEAGRASIVKFSASASVSAEAAAAIEHRADVYAAVAVGAAVRASFIASGAAASTLSAVDIAIEALVSSTMSASSRTEANAAFNAFGVSIESQLATELEVSTVIVSAAKVATGTAKSALDAAVDVAVDAQAVATAHKTFFVAAEAAASTALSTSVNASLGGEVLSLISLR